MALTKLKSSGIADGAVTADGLATNAITAADIADETITVAKISGNAAASADTFLKKDGTWASAGGDNTPYFYAYLDTDQAPSDASWEKVQLAAVSFQTGSTFSTADHRWTPGVAGKYYIYGQAQCRADSNNKFSQLRTAIYKNGADHNHTVDINVPENILRYYTSTVSAIIDLDADDYVEFFLYFDTYSGTRTIYGSYQATHFMGFKLLD
tara:strand:- start:229 stop:858 length:630 start_codon:yes stop_codon:yes gene_type:complete